MKHSRPAIVVARELRLPDDVVNVEGGAVAHGHPSGVVGAPSAGLASTAGTRGCWMVRLIVGRIGGIRVPVRDCSQLRMRYGAAAFAIMARRASLAVGSRMTASM